MSADSERDHNLGDAIAQAQRALAAGSDGARLLHASFTTAARRLGAERAFLARVHHGGEIGSALELSGLTPLEIQALRGSQSTTGVSVSLVRLVLESRQVQHVEDSRLRRIDLEPTDAFRGGDFSVVSGPVLDRHSAEILAILYFQSRSLTRPLTARDAESIRAYCAVLADTWSARAEHERQREDLAATLEQARERVRAGTDAGEIAGRSAAARALREDVRRRILPAFRATRPILILGPTGSGKGLLAESLHRLSPRARKPFVVVNCAHIGGDLATRELFGHTRGSFTGAESDSDGLFVHANGGTLFLDEVGELPPLAQSMLLRAIEWRVVRSLGDARERPVDVQLICATNVDLESAVREGRFRADLFQRLAGFEIELPGLADRSEDLVPLSALFIARAEKLYEKRTLGLLPETLECMQDHDWPGNVRELATVCEALVVCTEPGEPITPEILAGAARRVAPRRCESNLRSVLRALFTGPLLPLRAVRRIVDLAYIGHVLQVNAGNRSAAARILDVNRRTLPRLESRGDPGARTALARRRKP